MEAAEKKPRRKRLKKCPVCGSESWPIVYGMIGADAYESRHHAAEYLADETVAEAIGFAMFGSKSKEVDRAGIDIPLDGPERYRLLALRYAHHAKPEHL